MLLTLTLVTVAFSCTKPNLDLGNTISTGNGTGILTVDTFGVKLSTIYLDSFPTTGTGSLLIGRYTDPQFGAISSRTFTEFTYPSSLPAFSVNTVYDSLELIFRLNKAFYGDTLKEQRYLVNQLSKVMDFPYNQTTFFNIDSIPVDPTLLGSVQISVNPTAGFTSQKVGDSVKIRMPDVLGKQLFGLLFRGSDTVKSAATWRGFFKGLSISADQNVAGAMYGFKDTLLMRMFYHEPGTTIIQKTTDFPSFNKSTQFNKIDADRTGTAINGIDPGHKEILSTASGNASFLQPVTGIYVKMLFPTIGGLLQYPDYLSVLRAVLTVKPVGGTYSPIYSLPPQVQLASVDENNGIGGAISTANGSLVTDYLYGTNTAYSYDITSYIQSQITRGPQWLAQNGLALDISAPNYNTLFNRAVIGDQFTPLVSNQVSLKIFYASYY